MVKNITTFQAKLHHPPKTPSHARVPHQGFDGIPSGISNLAKYIDDISIYRAAITESLPATQATSLR
jgi:hypothetical protein